MKTNSRPLDGYGKLHRKLNDKVTPDSWRRGIITAIHVAAGTADVSLVGNSSSVMKNISLSSAVNPLTAKVGSKCRIDMMDESNPNDCVVAYIY